MLAKGRDRFSLLYRRSLSETGIDFTRRSAARRAGSGVVAKVHSTQNHSRSNRLWHPVEFFVEPPYLLSLRSLVAQFFPCNCYSRKRRKIANAHEVALQLPSVCLTTIVKSERAALVSHARMPRLSTQSHPGRRSSRTQSIDSMNGSLPYADEQRRSPLAGAGAIICGSGLLLGLQRLPWLAQHWAGFSRWVLVALAMGLLLWGITQLLALARSRQTATRRPIWNRNRMAITREGIVYVLIMSVMFLGAIIGRTNMLMFVFAMMIGPWVLNGWIAFSMLRRTHAKRALPQRVMAGEMVSVELEVSNCKWFLTSWLLAARDQITHVRDRFQAAALFVRIPARQSRRGHYFVRFSQRGEYSFGPLELTTHFPLGLVERGLLFNEFAKLIVHPRVGRMTARWRSDLWNASELAEQRRMRAGLFDDEFHRIREYRPGDNPKAIHWRTTARSGELMVREYQQTRDRDLVLLVELWQPAQPCTTDTDRVELAVSFAATVLFENVRQSREARLRMIVVGSQTFAWDQLCSLEQALDQLALASSSPTADVQPVIDEALQRISGGSRIVVVSSRPRSELLTRMRDVAEPVELLCLSAEIHDLSPYFVLEGLA